MISSSNVYKKGKLKLGGKKKEHPVGIELLKQCATGERRPPESETISCHMNFYL